MRRSAAILTGIVTLTVVVTLVLAACGGESAEEPAAPTAEPTATATAEPTATATATLDGAALVQERCTQCHGIDRIEGESESAAEWASIVDQMIARGAQLDEQEKQAVVDYLAEQFGE